MKLNTLFSWKLFFLVFSGLVLVTASCGKDDPLRWFQASPTRQIQPIFSIRFTNHPRYNFLYLGFLVTSATSTGKALLSCGMLLWWLCGTKLATKASDGGTDISTQVVTVGGIGCRDWPNWLAALTTKHGATPRWFHRVAIALEVGPVRDPGLVGSVVTTMRSHVAPCIMNDEFIFSRDKGYEYKTNGDDYWAEAVYLNLPIWLSGCNCCQHWKAKMVRTSQLLAMENINSTWVNGTKPTLTVIGKGAFIEVYLKLVQLQKWKHLRIQ